MKMFVIFFVIGVVAYGLRSPGISAFRRKRSLAAVEVIEGDAAFASACARQAIPCVQTILDEESGGRGVQYDVARKEIGAVEERLTKLLASCSEVAPRCVSISEKGFEKRAMLLARLASWTSEKSWVRPLEQWGNKSSIPKKKGERDLPLVSRSDLVHADPDDALRALVIYLLEIYEPPKFFRQTFWFSGDSLPVSSRNQRIAYRFSQAYIAIGAGKANVRNSLNAQGLTVTKKCASLISSDEIFQKYNDIHPLRLLRYAQVEALGGKEWLAQAVATSKLCDFFATDERFIAQDALKWLVTNAPDFEDNPGFASTALEFFNEMRRSDHLFSCSGRTVKKVAKAMEAYTASTISFDDVIDEPFLPNPRGLRPMLVRDASLDKVISVSVPYDDLRNGGHGPYKLGPGTGRLDSKNRVLRVEEATSLQRLIYEGLQLDNCLEDRQSSQIKYLTRARQRASSFWSFTLQAQDDDDHSSKNKSKPTHILLLEVWHLAGENIVRQAEGPRPRTLPSPEAWYYTIKWCEQNNVDWTTWDIYSRLDAIYPCDPL